MGIKTTISISREQAVDRIVHINQLVIEKNYRALQETTCEHDESFSKLVDSAEPLTLDRQTLMQWTDTMLDDKLDEPLYRFSMFENYLVSSCDLHNIFD